ncbi:MAG: rRNA maturation RNase YbeY [Puniceicoccaceae bacterium]
MMRSIGLVVGDSRLQIAAESVENCLLELDCFEQYLVAPGSIDVAFVTPEESGQLHRDFFDDPDPTDVMTFPGDPADQHAGDIAICPSIAAASATRENLPFEEELTLYLVHAWLHLAGLKDGEEDQRKTMRRAEAQMLEQLRKTGTLLKATWKA